MAILDTTRLDEIEPLLLQFQSLFGETLLPGGAPTDLGLGAGRMLVDVRMGKG